METFETPADYPSCLLSTFRTFTSMCVCVCKYVCQKTGSVVFTGCMFSFENALKNHQKTHQNSASAGANAQATSTAGAHTYTHTHDRFGRSPGFSTTGAVRISCSPEGDWTRSVRLQINTRRPRQWWRRRWRRIRHSSPLRCSLSGSILWTFASPHRHLAILLLALYFKHRDAKGKPKAKEQKRATTRRTTTTAK